MCYNVLEWKFKVLGNLRHNFDEAESMDSTPDYQRQCKSCLFQFLRNGNGGEVAFETECETKGFL